MQLLTLLMKIAASRPVSGLFIYTLLILTLNKYKVLFLLISYIFEIQD